MDHDLKKALIILALDNLANINEITLEDTQNSSIEEREYAQFIINSCRELISEMGQDFKGETHIPRPKWKKE